MTDPQPRVFVVDDDEPVRDAIGMLLDTVGIDYAAFASAQEFLDAYDPACSGCLVLDIRMPGMSGLDLQRKLLDMNASIPVVFITGHGDVPMAVEAMKRGAVDFIRKPFRDQELLDRVQEALNMDADQRAMHADVAAIRSRVAELTPREQQVFQRVADGQANKVVAIDLGISERTVEIHRSQVMQKTGARSLADLVRLKLALEQAGG
ncbi:MAG: response regulator transcription factor [Gammaproteobacteria bacterium]|nr:response regulator transcription factor [Gammaproteobacteria bacterium]